MPAHAAGPVAKFLMSPNPIAASGSLAAKAAVAVTLTAKDSGGAAIPGATVWLAFTPAAGGGSATAGAGATALTSTPASFTAGANGTVPISYKAPKTLPCSGIDSISATDAATGAHVHSNDTYNFSTVSQYVTTPKPPIAPPGSLASGANVNVTFTAETRAKAPVACATVYFSLKSSSAGLGSAKVGTTALSATPQPFPVNASGQVVVTYTASTAATLPTTGVDSLVAQDAVTKPRVMTTDAYSYGKAATYTYTPNPIAATHTLAANTKVKIFLVVTDGGGNPVSGAKVYLSFAQAPGGGSASVSGHALSTGLVGAYSDSLGRVTLIYQTPATLPASGTDTITGQNATKSPTVTQTDSYSF